MLYGLQGSEVDQQDLRPGRFDRKLLVRTRQEMKGPDLSSGRIERWGRVEKH